MPVEFDDEICVFCGRRDQSNMEMGTHVSPCRKCDVPVCDKCAEVDYDLVGDPPAFQCCQWTCPDCLERKAVA